jgi:RNA polymerase sigma-70 factor (ECF subfamily)
MTTDEDLFREWQGGSAGALEALVRRYHALLLAHLMRVQWDAQLAEDLVQETFLRLVREAHHYRYPRPFRPWLYTIARNLARTHWQSAYYRHETNDSSGEQEELSDEPDPQEWIERWEQREGLLHAMAGLSFEQRETLSLRFGQGLSVDEAALVMGINPGTVKSRTFTALRRLRDRLAITDNEQAASQGGYGNVER